MLYVLAGAFMISFASVFVKLADVGPSAAMFYRFLFGSIALFATSVIIRKSVWKGISPILWCVLIGLVFACDLFFWHRSIHYVGPGLATILANFQVFGLAAVGVFAFKEGVPWRLVVAVPLSIIGLTLVVGWDWSQLDYQYRLGLLYGILTAVCYTGLTLLLRKAQMSQNPLSPAVQMAWVSLFGAVAGSFVVSAGGEAFTIPDTKTLISLLGYGVVCSGLGWGLITTGLPRMPASVAGLVLILQPTAAFTWDILIFSRPTTPLNYLGAGLTLIAIYLGAVRSKTNN